MSIAHSRISSKGQTVIPKAVRERLGLKTGDLIQFQVGGKVVTITKAERAEADPFASFTEWASGEDDELYRDL